MNKSEWSNFDSQPWFKPLLEKYFEFCYIENGVLGVKDCLLYVSINERTNWYQPFVDQGYKILIDNLWGTGPAIVNNQKINGHLIKNTNWFWYNESLWYTFRQYHRYAPKKTYKKIALVPMNKTKLSHNMLYQQIENKLDKLVWSYVEKLNVKLPGSELVEDQRLFNPSWYNDTYFSLVSETVLDDPELHITEKTFKPIAFYHPFMVFGIPKTLQHLKSIGFETYENLFDESYDNIQDCNHRLDVIIKNLDRFVEEPYDSLTLEKINHNHQRFFNTDLVNSQIIKEIICPIIEYYES
jgi:hypothetical protein